LPPPDTARLVRRAVVDEHQAVTITGVVGPVELVMVIRPSLALIV